MCELCKSPLLIFIYVMGVFSLNYQKTNFELLLSCWTQATYCRWTMLRHPEAVCVTQDLDLTPGDNPRSVFAFCVASTCHLSSRRVVVGRVGALLDIKENDSL